MYDPLHHATPGQNQPYPLSYWAASAQLPKIAINPLNRSVHHEVVVIGGGYTGLSCAYHLAQYGVDVVVVEANQTAWGCSGRNAGFILKGSGRLGHNQLRQRFGDDVGDAMIREYQAGLDTVNKMIEEGEIDCDRQNSGYYKIAHSKRWIAPLQSQAELLTKISGRPVTWINADELKQKHVNHHGAHGGLFFSDSFAIHPLKLALGYAQMCNQSGVPIHTGSPALSIESANSRHIVRTPTGDITAKHVVIAGNGYLPGAFHSLTDKRTLPVLSSIIVTQPFSEQELQQAGIYSTAVVMDTRALKYYYRRLPDGRILFGGRGAITGKHADHPIFRERLLSALKTTFPTLDHAQAQYFWSGWISVALDDLPRIHMHNNIHYSMGYCGSGVSYSAQAGKRIAQRIVGMDDPVFSLPFYQTPLPRFPLAPLRRAGQWAFYHLGRIQDAL